MTREQIETAARECLAEHHNVFGWSDSGYEIEGDKHLNHLKNQEIKILTNFALSIQAKAGEECVGIATNFQHVYQKPMDHMHPLTKELVDLPRLICLDIASAIRAHFQGEPKE